MYARVTRVFFGVIFYLFILNTKSYRVYNEKRRDEIWDLSLFDGKKYDN